MKHYNKKGFSAVVVLLILIILAVIGFIGYYVWNTQKNIISNTTQNSMSESDNQTKSQENAPQASKIEYNEYPEIGVKAPKNNDFDSKYKLKLSTYDGGEFYYKVILKSYYEDLKNNGINGEELANCIDFPFGGTLQKIDKSSLTENDGPYGTVESATNMIEAGKGKDFGTFYILHYSASQPCQNSNVSLDENWDKVMKEVDNYIQTMIEL